MGDCGDLIPLLGHPAAVGRAGAAGVMFPQWHEGPPRLPAPGDGQAGGGQSPARPGDPLAGAGSGSRVPPLAASPRR